MNTKNDKWEDINKVKVEIPFNLIYEIVERCKEDEDYLQGLTPPIVTVDISDKITQARLEERRKCEQIFAKMINEQTDDISSTLTKVSLLVGLSSYFLSKELSDTKEKVKN